MAVAVIEAHLALPAGAALGEGPVWDERADELLFVDIEGHRVHTFEPASGAHRWFDVGRSVGAVVLCEDGSLLLAADQMFLAGSRDGASLRPFGTFRVDDDRVRFNDGKVDPFGRFYAGTMHSGEREAHGRLYVLEGDGAVRTALSDVTVSNGLAWDPSGTVLYYVDSPTRSIDAFDVEPGSGSLSRRRSVAMVSDGFPDGMAIDDEGMLWVAVWGGYRVDRVDPSSGRLLGRVRLPTKQVTSVAFGGPSLAQLYITTASTGLDPADAGAHAGDVFVVDAGVSGPASSRFAPSVPSD